MPIQLERTVFRTGASLAVTLPKAWARWARLKPGDSVEVLVDDELIIRVKQRVEGQQGTS